MSLAACLPSPPLGPPMRMVCGLAVVWIAVSVAAAESPKPGPKLPPAASGAAVDFSKDVWPILNANCIKCHNGDKRKGGLSLADGESAMAGGDSGKVVTV